MVRAWNVRGGRHGEREETALDEGMIILGWANLGDLANAASIEDVSAMLRAAYPADGPRTIDNWAHQLWRFLRVMQVGELVVMPREYKPVIAIGRVAGQYEYRRDVPSGMRHTRHVEWLNCKVERAAVGGDLRDSMGSFLTVSELSRRDAVQRVKSLVDSGTDPGYSGCVQPPADANALKNEVDESGTRQLSARDLIGLWGYQRRTTEAIEVVDLGLADRGLVVEPHFTAVQLGDLVTVSGIDTGDSGTPAADSVAELKFAQLTSSEDGEAQTVLAWRIGNLSLVRNVVTTGAQQPLGAAVQRMVAGEYSQLPVVEERGRLKGVITWESIAHAQFRGSPKTVGEAMLHNPNTGREGEELFARIDDIQRRGFLIIVDGEYVVTGILTAADLAGELRTRVQPFTVLEEIERRLRRAVSHLSVDDLRASFPKGHPHAKKVKSPRDLTLGNYSFLIDDETRWAKLLWPYERADMVQHLRDVADYRNDMTHWTVDVLGQDSEELSHAKQVLKLLKVIDRDPS